MKTTMKLYQQERSNRHGKLSPGLIIATVLALALALALGFSVTAAADRDAELDEALIFFELNDTDGDLGIHGLIDGDAWKRLTVVDPNGRRIMKVAVRGRLRRQGLTEIFFESAEPTFDELSPDQFFARFPEGVYGIKARTLEGGHLESEVLLSHVMPAPPETSVNGEPQANQCDDDEPDYDAPGVETPIVISWGAVTLSHPDENGGGAAVQPPVAITVHNYEVVLETELEIDGEEFVSVMNIIVPPGITSISLPEEFLEQSDEWKYEVLVREQGFNQTATESCFDIG